MDNEHGTGDSYPEEFAFMAATTDEIIAMRHWLLLKAAEIKADDLYKA